MILQASVVGLLAAMGTCGIPTGESQHRHLVLGSKAMSLAAGLLEKYWPSRDEASGHGMSEFPIMGVIWPDALK